METTEKLIEQTRKDITFLENWLVDFEEAFQRTGSCFPRERSDMQNELAIARADLAWLMAKKG